MAFAKFFGTEVLAGHGGSKVNVSSLEGKNVMVYFSAHWCPPCKGFTPVLAKWYNDIKAKRQDIEIVFVSSDKSQGEFDEYFKEMPWIALPFECRDQKTRISSAMGVQGIPTLVVLDAQANLVTKKGRDGVMSDPTGANFPWKPKTFDEMMAPLKIERKDGSVNTWSEICAKYDNVAFYFSAHWCPPCRAFTPKLIATYKSMMAKGVQTEFIFVSSDRDKAQYDEYRGEMPWASLGFQQGRELGEFFEVEGIPSLISFDTKTKTVINASCTDDVGQDPEGARFPWKPVPLELCAEMQPSQKVLEAVNEGTCIILYGSGVSQGELDAFRVAAAMYESARGSGPKVQFLYATRGDALELYGRIKEFLGLKTAAPKYVLGMALQKNKAHMVFDGAISTESVTKDVNTFLASLK